MRIRRDTEDEDQKNQYSGTAFPFYFGAAIIAAFIVGGVSYSAMGNYLRQKTMDHVVEIAVIAAENVDAELLKRQWRGTRRLWLL